MPKQKPPKPEAEVNESEPGADWFAPFTTPGKRVKLNAGLISKDEQNRFMAESPNPRVAWEVFWNLTNAPELIHTGAKVRKPFAEQNHERSRASMSATATWQERANELWAMPQHAHKSQSDIARLIDSARWNTVRRKIKKP